MMHTITTVMTNQIITNKTCLVTGVAHCYQQGCGKVNRFLFLLDPTVTTYHRVKQ